MADQKEPGFKVSDRRMFNADGTPRQQSEEPSKGKNSEAAPPRDRETAAADNIVPFPDATQNPAADGSWEPGQPASLPVVSFGGFINMLAVETAMHLGLVENPAEGGPSVDLEAARHMIDTLAVLQEKTRGNLTPEEANLLESILAELQMQFVVQSRAR